MKTKSPPQVLVQWRRWFGAGLILLALTFVVGSDRPQSTDSDGRMVTASACNGSGGGCG